MPDPHLQKPMQEAMTLYRAGRQDEAITTLRAIAVSARQPEVYALLARMLADAGRVDEAIATLRESAVVQRSAQTFSNLGMLLLSRNRPDEAI